MAGLLERSVLVKGKSSINLSGYFAGYDLENLLAELDQQSVEGGVNLLVDAAALG